MSAAINHGPPARRRSARMNFPATGPSYLCPKTPMMYPTSPSVA